MCILVNAVKSQAMSEAKVCVCVCKRERERERERVRVCILELHQKYPKRTRSTQIDSKCKRKHIFSVLLYKREWRHS